MQYLFYTTVLLGSFIAIHAEIVHEGMSSQEVRGNLNKTLEACRVQFNIDPAAVQNVYSMTEPIPTDNQDFKCMLKCLDEGLGYSKDDVIDWDLLKESQSLMYQDDKDVDKFVKIAADCEQNVSGLPVSDEPCNMDFLLWECLQSEYNAIGIVW